MLSTRVDQQRSATGIVVGIAQPDGNRVIAYGTRGLEDKTPVNGDTVYDIGSITKVFTALLLSDMAQRNEVALDDRAGKYLPGITLPSRNGKEISLTDLATHTSGLPLRPTNLASDNSANPYAGYTCEKLNAFVSGYTLTRDPGSMYEYSNVGFGLLGEALSLRAGKEYSNLVHARVTGPFGMRDTRIDPTRDMLQRAAIGYDSDLHLVRHWDMGTALVSAGAFRSTANDLLKFLDACLGFKKSELSPAMDAMLRVRRPGGMSPSSAIALAWNIYQDNGREIAWKNGSVGGYRAFIGYDRTARVGVVALANAQTGNGADDIGLHLLDPAYAVDLEIPKKHVEIALGEDALDQFVGIYRFSPTDTITIIRKGDKLHVVMAINQPSVEMYAEGPGDFFLKGVNVQVKFVDIKNGHATKAIWHQSGEEQTGERVE